MPENNSVFVCESESVTVAGKEKKIPRNFTTVTSNVQTLKNFVIVDPEDATKTKEIAVDPEKWLVKGIIKTKKGKRKAYNYSRRVAIPRLRKPKDIADFGVAVAELAEAIRLYDSCDNIQTTEGKVIPRLVKIATKSPTTLEAIDVTVFLYNMITGGIRLWIQKQGQKVNRPRAMKAVAEAMGVTLATSPEYEEDTEEEGEDYNEDQGYSED